MDLDALDWLTLVVAVASNVLTVLVFGSRPRHPALAKAFGLGYIALAFPAAAIIAINLGDGRPWGYCVPPVLFITFAILVLLLDYILRIEFRSPPRYDIMGPFLLLYYLAQMGMWGLTWDLGLAIWGLTGVTYFAQVAVGIGAERGRSRPGG
jgi:hypothetical protein